MRARLLLPVVTCVLLAWGRIVYPQDVSYQKAIIGSWEFHGEDILEIMHFDKDGTFIQKFESAFFMVMGQPGPIQTGTWVVKDGYLFITMKTSTPPQAESLLGKTFQVKIDRIDDKTLILSEDNGKDSIIYIRKK